MTDPTQAPAALIAFTSHAAAEHCDLTAFNRRTRTENGDNPDDWSDCFVDSSVCAGLRQTFEAEFSLDHLEVFSVLYRTMVNAIAPVHGLAAGEVQS